MENGDTAMSGTVGMPAMAGCASGGKSYACHERPVATSGPEHISIYLFIFDLLRLQGNT